jgi:hypothetical protein
MVIKVFPNMEEKTRENCIIPMLALLVHVHLTFGCLVWVLILLLLLWTLSTSRGSPIMWQFEFLKYITLKCSHSKLISQFASWVILFQETFEYQNVISICYGGQQASLCFFRMPIFQTWAIAHAITNTFHFIAKLCTSWEKMLWVDIVKCNLFCFHHMHYDESWCG